MSFDEQPDGDIHGECAEEIRRLQAQVEKLTKERDEWKNDAINGGNAGYLREQLAALAKQNEKMRKELEEIVDWTRVERVPLRELELESIARVLSLPNLATPVLNRIRAEGMRMAAEICETAFAHGILQLGHRAAISQAIRAKADELEQSDAAPSA